MNQLPTDEEIGLSEIESELAMLIIKGIQTLPKKMRAIAIDSLINGMTVKEIMKKYKIKDRSYYNHRCNMNTKIIEFIKPRLG